MGDTSTSSKDRQTTYYQWGGDGHLQKGVAWPNPRFIDNGDGTVTDNLTGLMWAKNPGVNGTMNWDAAIYYANNLSWAMKAAALTIRTGDCLTDLNWKAC